MADDKKDLEYLPVIEGPGEEERGILSYFNPFYNSIRLTDILLFTKYFAILAKSGLTVLRSLTTLSRQVKTHRFKKIIWQVKLDVEGGVPLNICFRRNEDVFGILYPTMVKVGEESGRLYMILDRLAMLLERQLTIRRRITSAMAYPIIISMIAVLVLIFLLLFIIPQFSALFEQFNQELPAITQAVIDISNFLLANSLNILAICLGGFLFIYQANNTEKGRNIIDSIKLRIPILGGMTKKYLVAMYTRNLATLFESGINIVHAMTISSDAVENQVLKRDLISIIQEIEGGLPIAKALAKVNMMPELSLQMIEVGEESGNLDEMLHRVADFYEDEINYLIDQMTALVEPAFIVVIGSVVGFIVLAMYLPIFRMAKVVSGGESAQPGI